MFIRVVLPEPEWPMSAIISIAITVMAILFLYGYLSPFGLSPTSVFGPEYGSFFGKMTFGATGFAAFGFGPLVPGGVVGLIAYTVLSRIGSVTAAATDPTVASQNANHAAARPLIRPRFSCAST